MHDPKVAVFDLHLPIPVIRWPRASGKPRWACERRRYVCPPEESPLSGEAIHPWWRPAAWMLAAAGREIGWMQIATIWHTEPGDRDSGEVCKGMGGTELTRHNIRWAWAHRAHCNIQWHHYQRARRYWSDRCTRCGLPFRGDYRTAYGEWGGDALWHEHCYRIEELQRTVDVFARYIALGEDEWTARTWAETMTSPRTPADRP